MLPLLKNVKGEPSFTLTASVLSLTTVLVKVVLSGAVVAGQNLGTVDAGVIAALLTPTLGAYVIRKGQDNGN
jgi:hypothetical protein